MKTNFKKLAKTMVVTSIFTGALWCWSTQAAEVQETKPLWDHNCAACHGKEGKGDTLMGRKLGVKDYSDPKVQSAMKDEEMTKAIKEGVKEDGKQKMKAFGDKFSDEQIKDLVQYIRSLKSK